MKKLKLKALELGASELLQREQLRNVIGGSGGSGGSGNPYVDGCGVCRPTNIGYIGCYRRQLPGDCLCVYEGVTCTAS